MSNSTLNKQWHLKIRCSKEKKTTVKVLKSKKKNNCLDVYLRQETKKKSLKKILWNMATLFWLAIGETKCLTNLDRTS